MTKAPKPVLFPTPPSSPVLIGSSASPQSSAFAKFNFSPFLSGFTPRTGGRRSLIGG